jgi:glucokinase
MFLGIEIGATKLQFGVGSGMDASLVELARLDVDRAGGAEGIRRQMRETVAPMLQRHSIRAIGVGFGGPVDIATGCIVKSHQIDGWDQFPLVDWSREQFGLPMAIVNDTDAGGLAEARFGAGRGRAVVFYTNVGSGIGGALILDGQIYCRGARISAELGHVRPGPEAERPDQTIESLASGWAITGAAKARLRGGPADPSAVADLMARCNGDLEQLTTIHVSQAATEGNRLALDVFARACRVFGWGIAQVITLLAPDVVVIGGGVSLSDDSIFLTPLRNEVNRYVLPPQLGRFEIVRAELGEEMVVFGALAMAAELPTSGNAAE